MQIGEDAIWFRGVQNYHGRYTKHRVQIVGITKSGRFRIKLYETGEIRVSQKDCLNPVKAKADAI